MTHRRTALHQSFTAALVLASAWTATVYAQHEQHTSPPSSMSGMDKGQGAQPPTDGEHGGESMQHGGMEGMSMRHGGMEGMRMGGPLGIPLTREGSGTGWQPDVTPMWALHAKAGSWQLMFHENAFVGVDSQGGDRGDTRVFSSNWLMGMARHDLGPGEILVRVMLSLEPLTVGGAGYPLLLETGETWHGAPLHDHQHPHDLFSEVALQYWTGLSDDVGALFYVGPAGEPALGPVAFPHRTSGRSDPLGVIGHHWQDSTHISYGVLTAGIFTRQWKLDASWFNGREPNENRYNFDWRVPDSFSGRITWNPDKALSVQASYGFLKSPEEQLPDQSLQRVTASATFNRRVFQEGNWATTGVVGINIPEGETATSASLLETNLDVTRHHTFYQRFEIATKTGTDFVLPPAFADQRYMVAALAAGYVFSLDPIAGFVLGLGVRGSINVIGADLAGYYGSRTPLGAVIYVQARPADMDMMQMHDSM
jgi:hypothetical protein